METTFIYALTEPITGTIRYIGKANNPQVRYRNHLKGARDDRRDHKSNWIRKLLNEGQKPRLVILEECSVEVWKECECAWIAKYKDNNVLLCNHKDGGDGSNPDAATREKMRLAKLGTVPHNKGKKTPPEVRAKQSAAARQRVARNPQMMRERMLKASAVSADNRRGKPGRKKLPEEIEKIRRSLQGRPGAKGRKMSPEVLARHTERMRGHATSEETRRKIGLAKSKLNEAQQREFALMVQRGDAHRDIMAHFEITYSLFWKIKRRQQLAPLQVLAGEE